MQTEEEQILVVDDIQDNRDLLGRYLKKEGFSVLMAENGRVAIEMMRARKIDLVLLDIMMPEMDGYEVLKIVGDDSELRNIPIIVITAVDELDSVVRCIELGADDYLVKPFIKPLLHARVGACLEKKRFRDREQESLRRLQEAQERSERLLLSILPEPIAARLKGGEGCIAEEFPEATIVFADISDFARISRDMSPTETVQFLNSVFTVFDSLAERHGLEKIKTIGDAYMAVAGLPVPRTDHAEAAAEMALSMQAEMARLSQGISGSLSLRVGIHTGSVVAGVIGSTKFSYDLWGDTVNVASAMESDGLPGAIQVSATTCERLRERYILEERGTFYVKGKGDVTTYLLTGRSFSSS